MDLKTVNIQEVNGSCFIYLPKVWVNRMSLKKGDKMIWTIKEGNHEILYITKKSNGGDGHV